MPSFALETNAIFGEDLSAGTGTLAVHVAVSTGKLTLTREKRVGCQVEWLRHYHIWYIKVAFYKTTR